MKTGAFVTGACCWLVLFAGLAFGVSAASAQGNTGLHIPSSVAAEHHELHAELARVVALGGQTGRAAREVDRLLRPHFIKEEQFALPELGVLPALAKGERIPDAGRAMQLSAQLKAQLPQMLHEHRIIVGALRRLREAARTEHQPAGMRFADHLIAHAQSEEQVLYPSAVLVGEYLQLQRRE